MHRIFNIFQNKSEHLAPEIEAKAEALEMPVSQELESLSQDIHDSIEQRWGKHHYDYFLSREKSS
jgi:hypothetical protein